jgi:hypothetical protein
VQQATAGVDDVGHVAVAFCVAGGEQRARQFGDNAVGLVQVKREGANAVPAHRADAVRSTNQPAAVSMCDPQLPTWISSQPRRGACSGTGGCQRLASSRAVRPIVSPSERHSARRRPSMVRGNTATPLRTPGARIGVIWKWAKSSLLSRRAAMCRPS